MLTDVSDELTASIIVTSLKTANFNKNKKLKLSLYTPWRRLRGEEI
jgi:hypothetical protein